ncbi:unnamed protein product [Dibothriocephalus latus]|uniref:Uncharacterized protein n=1 Tax=Dibothriocephalus latus TaxID=60516 RepID=A0A3P7L9V5_DIBLA|nr:unnamed protein product [Dibothriocephalus latus]
MVSGLNIEIRKSCLRHIEITVYTMDLTSKKYVFWTCCSSLANSQLRQAPFPSIVPPWAVQSMGRPLFNVCEVDVVPHTYSLFDQLLVCTRLRELCGCFDDVRSYRCSF